MSETLLPGNATPIEKALDQAGDPEPKILPALSAITGWKHSLQPSDLRPFLVHEYGLGILKPFVSTNAGILALRRPWCEVRGTHEAVFQGLSVTGYAGTLVDPPARRFAWAEFQINLDRVRDTPADLGRISGMVDLSIPERSTFRRGVHGYDISAAEGSRTKLSRSTLSSDSGVRIGGKGPKWSFGRGYQLTQNWSEADLTALGIWIPEVPSAYWADMHFPWVTADFLWSDDVEVARRASLAASLAAMPVWLRFADAADQTIGYRRALCHGVAEGVSGYPFGGSFLSPTLGNPTGVLVFARTGFGDGDGATAATVSMIFNVATVDATRPGRLWLGPDELAGGTEIAPQPVNIAFGKTVREHVQIFMRF